MEARKEVPGVPLQLSTYDHLLGRQQESQANRPPGSPARTVLVESWERNVIWSKFNKNGQSRLRDKRSKDTGQAGGAGDRDADQGP